MRRLALPLFAAAALLASAGGSASAAPAVRIDSLRIVTLDGRPAAPPYQRARRYDYIVRFRLGGPGPATVTRAATLVSVRGFTAATVRPRATLVDPGTYTARARLRIGTDDRAGVYVLRYTVVARGLDGSVGRARRVLRLRFR